jgi:hypothetical protein
MFTDRSVSFVCNSTSEQGHKMAFDFDREAFSRTLIPRHIDYHKRRVINFDKSRDYDQKEMSDIWASTIESYSSRVFTLWDDRLTALAGVAAKFGSIWGNTNYFAGLWNPCLTIHLCWRRHRGLYSSKKVPHPHVLQSPTWPWSTFPHRLQLDVQNKKLDAGCKTH